MDSAMRYVLRLSLLELLRLSGFHSAESSSLEVLTDCLERYLRELALSSRASTELSSRSISNVDDVALAFKEHNVTVEDLIIQLDWVDEADLPLEPPPTVPVARESLPAIEAPSQLAAAPFNPSVRLDTLKARPVASGTPAKSSLISSLFATKDARDAPEQPAIHVDGSSLTAPHNADQVEGMDVDSVTEPKDQVPAAGGDDNPVLLTDLTVAPAAAATPETTPVAVARKLQPGARRALKSPRHHLTPNHPNPFLRLSAAKDKTNGISKPHPPPGSSTSREGPLRLLVKQPAQTGPSPYQLALQAVEKLKPVISTRALEKDQALNPVETINFSMLTNVGDIVSSDRGMDWNDFVVKKRKGGRPPKIRDPDTGAAAASSSASERAGPSSIFASRSEVSLSASQVLQAQDTKSNDDKKLSNWFEGLGDQDWSSEESEEDEDLEAKMKREREIEEHRRETREKRREKRAKEQEEIALAMEREAAELVRENVDVVGDVDVGMDDFDPSAEYAKKETLSIKFNFGSRS